MMTFTKVKYGFMCAGALLAPAFGPVVFTYKIIKNILKVTDGFFTVVGKVFKAVLLTLALLGTLLGFHYWTEMKSEVEYYYNIFKIAAEFTVVNPTLIKTIQVEDGNTFLTIGLEMIRLLV